MSVPMDERLSAADRTLSTAESPADTSTSGSPLLRFFDSFLQERNIRWMLGLGMLILFGSSLTLVRAHWDTLTLPGRHLVLLGYTAVVGGLGTWAYRRLGLRKTGTVLYALTVLLIPLTFVAWHVMRSNAEESLPWLVKAGLLTLNLVGAAVGAHLIFKHLLRGTQPTFLACYLLLSFAGAVVPALSVTWWPLTGFVLWAAFAIGALKVNRHVFWITEEQRLPRIFGFFPIALLGTQFLLLTGFVLGPTIWKTQPEWLGLACMLTAMPVLLTAETVACVFEQRTGNLVRPLPWSIVLPLFTGLALSFLGLAVSAMGLPFPTALVPTGALFAVTMTVAARRTGKPVFVWLALIGLTLSYNFSYTFFRDAAKQAIVYSAEAIHETRLPFAYYGLTYLPLLTALTVVGGRLARRGHRLFAQPIGKFVVGLTWVLQLAACTHLKAIFPVSLALLPMFVAQAIIFRNRVLLIPALISYFAASFGFGPYLETVLMDITVFTVDLRLVWPAAATGLLLICGPVLDRLSARLPFSTSLLGEVTPDRSSLNIETNKSAASGFYSIVNGPNPGLCRHASWIVTLLITAAWCSQAVLHGTPNWLMQARVSEFFIGGLLVAQALAWKNEWLGAVSLGFGGFALVMHGCLTGVPLPWVCVYVTPVLIGLWCLSSVLKNYRIPRVSAAYGKGSELFSGLGLSLLMSLFYLFDLTTTTFHDGSWHRGYQGLSEFHGTLLWGCRLAIVAWAFDAARRYQQRPFSCLGAVGVLGLCSAALTEKYGFQFSFEWIPLTWTVATLGLMAVLIPVARRKQFLESEGELTKSQQLHVDRLGALAAPLDIPVPALLLLMGVVSLIVLLTPVQIAGAIALGALLWLAIRIHNSDLMRLACILLNLHGIVWIVQFCSPHHEVRTIMNLSLSGLVREQTVLLLALLCMVSSRLWSHCLSRLNGATIAEDEGFDRGSNLSRQSPSWTAQLAGGSLIPIHIALLKVITGLLLVMSISYVIGGHRSELPIREALALIATYGVLIAGHIRDAFKQKSEAHVWQSLGMVVGMVLHLAILGLIEFGMGIAVYVLMGTGFAMWGIGWSLRNDPRYSVLSRPFQKTGFLLPLAGVAWAVGRRMLPISGHGYSVETMALLLPAAFYMWRGLEDQKTKLTVFAVALFNLTLALLWHDLQWHDPQLYLMPAGLSILALVGIMSHEIPRQYHTPLRYVGALFILVSPTFNLVQGSWLHITTLMAASVVVALLGIGLRIRPFLYCGAAFLIADLAAMVVLGGIHDRTILWASGIALGTFVLLLGAYFEKRREHLLQRLRILSAQLESWK